MRKVQGQLQTIWVMMGQKGRDMVSQPEYRGQHYGVTYYTPAGEKFLLFSQWNLVFSAKPLLLFKCHFLASKTGKGCQGAKNILETVLVHVCQEVSSAAG